MIKIAATLVISTLITFTGLFMIWHNINDVYTRDLTNLTDSYYILEARYKDMMNELEKAKSLHKQTQIRCTELMKTIEMDIWGGDVIFSEDRKGRKK